ncbi:hypothetical protein OG352_34360 [Streptomyces sp. NBC_01485]|uniref:hypothetical protein n=1 Tax=Streptomyces sp. NBC_01485 TaxID=2903884 RepID=UPI002E354F71|nr:hypothetical protein [Streptomyces sp. NBC_01485]
MGAPVLAVLLVMAVTGSFAHVDGDWFDAAQTIHLSLVQITPFAMAIACWQGGTEPRAGAEWVGDSAARGPWTRALLSLTPSVLWPTVLLGLGIVGVLAVTWPTATGARPPLPLALYALLVLAGATGTAHILGALLPQRIVPLLVGAAAVWPLMVSNGGDVLGFELPSQRPYVGPDVPGHSWLDWTNRLVPGWLPWITLTSLLLAAATVLALRAGLWRFAVFLIACLLPLTLLDPLRMGDIESGVGTIAVRCSAAVPAVCLSEDRVAHKDELTEVAAHFGRLLAGVRGAPTHYLGTAETLVGDLPQERGWALEISLDSTREQRFRITARYLAGWNCCRSTTDQAVVDAVTQWLLPAEYRQQRLNLLARAVISRLDSMSRADRADWLSQYLTAIRTDDRLTPPLNATTP